ncbi:hypothetical protein TYRP_009222 [Tyrophagus putrescentiae]|nr:hypothetical protein TYRP_009222 [Tyrophagus putrescentiae]
MTRSVSSARITVLDIGIKHLCKKDCTYLSSNGGNVEVGDGSKEPIILLKGVQLLCSSSSSSPIIFPTIKATFALTSLDTSSHKAGARLVPVKSPTTSRTSSHQIVGQQIRLRVRQVDAISLPDDGRGGDAPGGAPQRQLPISEQYLLGKGGRHQGGRHRPQRDDHRRRGQPLLVVGGAGQPHRALVNAGVGVAQVAQPKDVRREKVS